MNAHQPNKFQSEAIQGRQGMNAHIPAQSMNSMSESHGPRSRSFQAQVPGAAGQYLTTTAQSKVMKTDQMGVQNNRSGSIGPIG